MKRSDRIVRMLLGFVGVLAIGYGGLRLVTEQRSHLLGLAEWLLGSVLLHDVIIAPLVIGIGWLINRHVAVRLRPYVQGALVTAALVGSVAVILILRQGKYSAASLTLLRQNYVLNTAILFALIVVGAVIAYLIRTNRTKTLPPADQ